MTNFWDFNVWGTFNVVAVLLVSLLAANMLKKAIPFLQASLIPTSVLGGGILIIVAGIFKSITGQIMFDTAFFASYLLSHIVDANIMIAPKITNTTIELGTKYSPEFVCTPFKYTLGTFIEALDRGADVLIQAGGGCRYGYYCELQEKILKDLGYEFTYINLMSKGKKDLKKIYNSFKKIDSKFKIVRALYYFLITKQMVKYMDRIDDYIRKNIGFEKEKGSFEKLKNEMLESFKNVKNLFSLRTKYTKYRKKFKKIPIKKCNKKIRVGVIGELYTIMEPFANYNLECELAQ